MNFNFPTSPILNQEYIGPNGVVYTYDGDKWKGVQQQLPAQVLQNRQAFVCTDSQTSFATAGYTAGFLDVYLNGVHLLDSADYTATNGSDIVLTVGAAAGDVLEVVSYSTFEVLDPTFTGTTTVDALVASGVDVATASAFLTLHDTAGNFSTNTADARLTLKSGNLTAAEIGFINTTSGQFVVRNRLDGDMRFRLETTSKKFRFEDTTGSNTIATINHTGLKIGGGNTSASEALEVVGNIVATGLTVTDAYAWLNIDGSSTAQYSGGNLWLSNSATANNYGVALSSQIANADTTGSTFALNEVNSTGNYSKTIFSYDHNNSTFSHNQYNYFNSGLGVAGNISVTGTVDGRDVAADGTKLDLLDQGVATTDSPTFADLTLSGGVYLGGTGAANNLDDYEFGTWTPVLVGASGTPSYTLINAKGYYVKVGKKVHVSMDWYATNVSGGSGDAYFTGLPFLQDSSQIGPTGPARLYQVGGYNPAVAIYGYSALALFVSQGPTNSVWRWGTVGDLQGTTSVISASIDYLAV